MNKRTGITSGRLEAGSPLENHDGRRAAGAIFRLLVLELAHGHFYFRRMKRIFCCSLLSLLIAAPLLRGQDSSTVAAAASRQEAQENYQTLKGHVDDLIAAQETQEKRIQALAKEIADLREQMGKPTANNYATRDELKTLADAIKDVDAKRVADNEKMLSEISRQIAKLGKASAQLPPPHGVDHSVDRTVAADPGTGPKTSDEGFWYEVKPGDTFSKIAAAYRDQGVKVTTDQIAKANPGVDSTKLKVGQKIFVPAPKGATGGK
jgi:LysM repeat protein